MGECDRAWERIMEERFQLKEYGHLNFFEQAQMPADERKWYLERLQKEAEERAKKEKDTGSHVPGGVPNMPNVPRP